MPDQSPTQISFPNSSSQLAYNTQEYNSPLPLASKTASHLVNKPKAQKLHLVKVASPSDQAAYTQPTLVSSTGTNTAHDESLPADDMFAAMRNAIGGGGGGNGAIMAVQMELQQLKATPILNPHFGLVNKYLDCLNRYMDAMIMTQGPAGVKVWLLEVQHFIRQLQRRTFQRMPLLPQERQAILAFTAYWRQMVSPPYAMGRPEAQLVLITLTETAQR